jgi:hypothetical protein
VFDYFITEAGTWDTWSARLRLWETPAPGTRATALLALPSLLRTGVLSGPANLWSIAFDANLDVNKSAMGVNVPSNKAKGVRAAVCWPHLRRVVLRPCVCCVYCCDGGGDIACAAWSESASRP